MSVVLECEVFACRYNRGGECGLDYVRIDDLGECGEFVYQEAEDED